MKYVYKNFWRFFFLLMMTNGIGLLSNAFMNPESQNWYFSLTQSPLSPPDFAFPLVWSVLFVLMSFSAMTVWNKASPRYFVMQLIAVMLWSCFFFGFKNPVLATLDIMALILFLLLNIRDFYKVRPVAGILLIPELLWAFFALYLNVYIVYAN